MKFRDIPQFVEDGNYEVDIPFDHIIGNLNRWNDQYTLNLDPDFQRKYVWTEKQQIQWLEFFLQGGKSGRIIYFNHPSWMITGKSPSYNEFVLVDGKQRLQAAKLFLNNQIKVFDHYYSEYEDKINYLHTLRFNVNTLKTKKEVLMWYLQMNSGGTPHTQSELNKVKQMLEIL